MATYVLNRFLPSYIIAVSSSFLIYQTLKRYPYSFEIYRLPPDECRKESDAFCQARKEKNKKVTFDSLKAFLNCRCLSIQKMIIK